MTFPVAEMQLECEEEWGVELDDNVGCWMEWDEGKEDDDFSESVTTTTASSISDEGYWWEEFDDYDDSNLDLAEEVPIPINQEQEHLLGCKIRGD